MPLGDFKTKLLPSDLSWPLVSLDFEASGLGDKTYPIEVGVAIWGGPDQPIKVWSSLIAPDPSWTANGVWNPASEPIHNIPRAALADGRSPAEIMEILHRLIKVGGSAFVDGGKHDQYWLNRLTAKSGVPALFFLLAWQALEQGMSAHQRMAFSEWAGGQVVPHRAGPDAALNIQGFAYGLGLAVPDVINSNFTEM